MKKNIGVAKFFMAGALSLALFGAVACSDDDSSGVGSSKNDNSQLIAEEIDLDSAWKSYICPFEAKKNLPECNSSVLTVSLVYEDSTFYTCKDREWLEALIVVPDFEQLPKCDDALDDMVFGVGEIEKDSVALFMCDEGEWVDGNNDNFIKPKEFLTLAMERVKVRPKFLHQKQEIKLE